MPIAEASERARRRGGPGRHAVWLRPAVMAGVILVGFGLLFRSGEGARAGRLASVPRPE